jgi:hypothetical protein
MHYARPRMNQDKLYDHEIGETGSSWTGDVGCIASRELRPSVFYCVRKRVQTAFKPAFSFTQMETFGPAWADMAPTASLAVRAMKPVFKPVAGSLLGITSQGRKLIWRQKVVMRILASRLSRGTLLATVMNGSSVTYPFRARHQIVFVTRRRVL